MRFLILLSAFLLTACVGNPPRQTEIARHDLGDPEGRWPATGVAISRVDVRVAAWLDSPAQLYRLNYADPLRRQSYAENRWVAPPGELLERWLQRRILSGQRAGIASGCRLVLWLDELEQRFDAPRSSQVVLDVRASLQALRGDAILAQQEGHMVKAAPTPDARGGVQATRAASEAMAGALANWLVKLASEQSPAIAICKEKP
jgi:cholesterol transport system auxiliary component